LPCGEVRTNTLSDNHNKPKEMPKFAPTDYIQSYYEKSLAKAQEFPKEYSFYQSFLISIGAQSKSD